MNHQTDRVREQVSALMDGHLQGNALAEAMAELSARDELRAAWQTYHVVGDVLRSGAHAPCSDSNAFLAKLQQQLAAESVAPTPVPAVPVVIAAQQRAEPANEPVFRWKLVAGAASLAAVAAISWNWVGSTASSPESAQLAQTQPPAISVLAASDPKATSAIASAVPTRVQIGNGAPQVMLRDARLDELLAAHQQAGGGSQMPSTFLRNATFEGPSR
ncbi:sigma-E factor negative regulatory protein [Variovorax sp. RT4R15]|uniref:sigma-E factor negative regulatory protein n=1 Tax=Variovorax sp. RT4R15 TaxID=3443737 RepID=UPI003F46EF14